MIFPVCRASASAFESHRRGVPSPAARKSSRNPAARVGALLLAAIGLGAWMMPTLPGWVATPSDPSGSASAASQ